MMILVTGASASGKSAFAEDVLVSLPAKRRIYAATMIPWDEECRERIGKHREKRKEKAFETAEIPTDLEALSVPEGSAVLLECMSNLAANELYRTDLSDNGPVQAKERILRGICNVCAAADLVAVTNEVFDDGEDYGEETNGYRALLGELNRELAGMADQVYEVVCGIPLRLK